MKVITLGEVLLRLSPKQLLATADGFSACFGGGEANVASALAGMGIPARHITALPANDLGRAALADLGKCGVATDAVLMREGRMGLYFYEAGSSLRAGKVLYDRKNSAFALTPAEDYALSEAMQDGSWLHLSGITPALGSEAKKLTLSALKHAKALGLTTSFDVNFRPSLMSREEAGQTFCEIMPLVDVCIVSSHGCDVLGIRNGGTDPAECERAAWEIRKKFGCRAVALTVRDSLSASVNELSGVLLTERIDTSPKFKVELAERVGGGDAFAAGLIYGMLKDLPPQETVDFAAAAEAYKHTLCGDKMCVPAEEIYALLSGDTRVRR